MHRPNARARAFHYSVALGALAIGSRVWGCVRADPAAGDKATDTTAKPPVEQIKPPADDANTNSDNVVVVTGTRLQNQFYKRVPDDHCHGPDR